MLLYCCEATRHRCSLHIIIYYIFDICILRCVFSEQPVPQGEVKSAEWTICPTLTESRANWMSEYTVKLSITELPAV